MKYIDAEKLKVEIEFAKSVYSSPNRVVHGIADAFRQDGRAVMCDDILKKIDSLQQEQIDNMIQWTGNNLKEVIDFTGKSPRFEEWFKSLEEYENYVHSHNDILKLFSEDGSHYEVPVGAWIVKTPDGYNVPSVAKYVKQKQPEVDLKKEIDRELDARWKGEYLSTSKFRESARHFYELGLNARNED